MYVYILWTKLASNVCFIGYYICSIQYYIIKTQYIKYVEYTHRWVSQISISNYFQSSFLCGIHTSSIAMICISTYLTTILDMWIKEWLVYSFEALFVYIFRSFIQYIHSSSKFVRNILNIMFPFQLFVYINSQELNIGYHINGTICNSLNFYEFLYK